MDIVGWPVLATLVVIIVALLALAAAAFVSVFLLLRFFAQMSGLTALARRYPADDQPQGREYVRQTVQIGAIRYRQCVTLWINPQGFYLWVRPRLSKVRPIFIPWRAVERTQEAKLYGSNAVRLSIAGPQAAAVTVYVQLYQVMSPYLALDLDDAR